MSVGLDANGEARLGNGLQVDFIPSHEHWTHQDDDTSYQQIARLEIVVIL